MRSSFPCGRGSRSSARCRSSTASSRPSFSASERAETVCAEALTLGVLDERDGRLELHPLAATFLEARARRDAGEELDRAAPVALAAYRRRREWDAAFDVVDRFGMDAELEPLVAESLDELLNAGRLTTLEKLD